jgi:hypothetical protein
VAVRRGRGGEAATGGGGRRSGRRLLRGRNCSRMRRRRLSSSSSPVSGGAPLQFLSISGAPSSLLLTATMDVVRISTVGAVTRKIATPERKWHTIMDPSTVVFDLIA